MSNPVIESLSDYRLLRDQTTRTVTYDDIVLRTGLALAIVTASAVVSAVLAGRSPELASPLCLGGMLSGLVIVIVAGFRSALDSPVTTVAYSVASGTGAGAFTVLMAGVTVGGKTSAGALAAQAVAATLAVAASALLAYKSKLIRVTSRFRRCVFLALCGAVGVSLFNLVLYMVTGSAPLRDGGGLDILLSLVFIGIAAACLVVDFDDAVQAVESGAPERAAWHVALGITIALVWVYLEIVRLLSLTRD